MLVFLDESGDTGRKVNSGSSQYFVVSIALFDDNDEASRCDQRIELLRNELNRPDFEFHFSDNSRNVRKAFLEAINPYHFSYITVAIDKTPDKLYGAGFNNKESFYKYACHMVLTNALPYLESAKLIIDKSGNGTFQGELRRYLRNKLGDPTGTKINSFKPQDSRKNNLLQLVDYCAGISARKVQNKKDWQDYYKYISAKELNFQLWPKGASDKNSQK
jgi:hypothetical protein